MKAVSKKIKRIRRQMHEAIENRRLTDGVVVSKSQELDILINEFMKKSMKFKKDVRG